VRVDSRAFTVAGVMESKGGLMSSDDSVFIPITTAMYRLGTGVTTTGEHNVAYVTLKVTDEDEIDSVADQVAALIRERHRIAEGKENDFAVTSQKDILQTMSVITTALTLFRGIGIMNIMLVSVTERTREIGIRKAVGAKRRDILMQFLIESATLSLLGGLIGILCGWALAEMISHVGISMGEGMKLTAVVSPDIVALAVGVSVAIGIFFGSWPAARAARLNPIDALRHE
jgi:putative ABC transport system permease protein